MQKHLFLLLAGLSVPMLALSIAASGCGEVIVIPADDEDGGVKGDARHDGKPGIDPDRDGGDAGLDALPDYTDPGCPDAGPPITNFQCDPYNQSSGFCGPGEGCYIFVQYPPPGDICGQEIYGAICAPSGPGSQGDACGGATDCGGGFVCVVSGSGNQCVKLCKLSGDDGCPAGLVCEPIDVEGFGGCL
jgi:hypothetical protein